MSELSSSSLSSNLTLQAGTPKISVVMSVYNGEPYLAGAIESVLAQTFTDFEFIIINDGSTDGSIKIIAEYAGSDPRIRIIDQKNAGLTIALRTGCDAARGQYIARMDADDFSMPTRLEKQVALLENDPALIAATGDVEHVLDDGTIVNVSKTRGDARLIRFFNCFCNHIGGHGQMMFRRDAYMKSGGYDPAFRMAQDYDLWARLLRLGDFGNVPETIYRFRTGHNSISSRSSTEQAIHSIHTTQREFERMTAQPLNENAARVLLNFWAYRPPIPNMRRGSSAASDAMRIAAKAFFEQNPDLRRQQFGIYKDIAAKWWWWTKRVAPYSLDRATFILNFVEWGTRAVWARMRHGAGP